MNFIPDDDGDAPGRDGSDLRPERFLAIMRSVDPVRLERQATFNGLAIALLGRSNNDLFRQALKAAGRRLGLNIELMIDGRDVTDLGSPDLTGYRQRKATRGPGITFGKAKNE